MNYKSEAATYLKKYNTLEKSVDRIQKRIDRLCTGPRDIAAMTYDKPSSANSPVHDEAINTLYELQVLTQSLDQTQQDIRDIDSALDHVASKLSPLHRKVLVEIYVNGKSLEIVSSELGYSDRQIQRKKHEALSEFAILFLGIIAIQGE